jgi:hypothetical protein
MVGVLVGASPLERRPVLSSIAASLVSISVSYTEILV